MASIIASLPEREKKALELCGITQDTQLASAALDDLLVDLRKAQRYFPEEASALTSTRLKEIHSRICQNQATAVQPIPDGEEAGDTAPVIDGENGGAQEDPTSGLVAGAPARSYPVLNPRRHQHKTRYAPQPKEKDQAAPGRSRSVHCSRPVATYLAAVSMILFYGGLVSMVMVPALLFMHFIEPAHIFAYFALAVACMIPYALHGAWVGCSVCNMKFFMLRHYNINRHAHKIPLLEWTTLPTALHIIFLLWYRCPACGTSLRLYRHRH